jgi:AraC-like DNA-binding protein/ligand-binding sensor protein
MLKTSIIQRRDLEPLWSRATKVAQHYEKAANCIAAVIGADYESVKLSDRTRTLLFCTLCKRYCHAACKLEPHEIPCSAMHLDAVREAQRLGGSYVYTCPIGFFFWTSPFFSGERFAGALTSGGVLALDRPEIIDRLYKVCKGEISRAEIAQYIEGIPRKSSEEVKVLAQMMLLCTENISSRESQWEDSPKHDTGQKCSNQQLRNYSQDLLDQERQLIANLRRGDTTEAQTVLRELLNSLKVISNDNFEHFKLKVIELVVSLSRTGANSENNEEFVENNDRYLKKIMDSKTSEEVTENMYVILERMAGMFFSFQGICHASALRKAERFIWENYTRKVSLKEIADVSGLSAPYFSTIFKDEMGENLTNYLNRLRVEKAAAMLRESEFSISQIAVACGFEDQSWFSKIFKIYAGISPAKYREHGWAILPDQGYKARQVRAK